MKTINLTLVCLLVMTMLVFCAPLGDLHPVRYMVTLIVSSLLLLTCLVKGDQNDKVH